jgi:hypothetical protein
LLITLSPLTIVSASAMRISGEANILWSPGQFGDFNGAQRFVEIKLTAILISNKAVLTGGTDVELSPKLSDTDIWTQCCYNGFQLKDPDPFN